MNDLNANFPKQAISYKVLALYKFTPIPLPQIPSLREEVEAKLRIVNAKGTIILACEGINGTICYPNNADINDNGSPATDGGDDDVLLYLQSHQYFKGLQVRSSHTNTPIFYRLKVKVKKVIVTMMDDEEKKFNNCNGSKDGKEEEESDENSKGDTLRNEMPGVDPSKVVGKYVKPGKAWDKLLLDPDVVVIDTRNKYEVEIGSFENAISPDTDNFKQFSGWLQRFASDCAKFGDCDSNCADGDKEDQQCVSNSKCININYDSPNTNSNITTNTNARSIQPVPSTSMPQITKRPKAIAMFCTGGIRCEKATSYALMAQVFQPEVTIYHLEGGILAYLDSHCNAKESKWKGECFVFDQRVAVGHGLKPSDTYNSCYGCRRPVSQEDKLGENYVQGIFCKNCRERLTEKQRIRFEERERQINLSKERGVVHIHDPKDLKNHIHS